METLEPLEQIVADLPKCDTSPQRVIPEMPYECEAHHFKYEGYYLKGYSFSISREEIAARRSF